jgi:hypothetical protein
LVTVLVNEGHYKTSDSKSLVWNTECLEAQILADRLIMLIETEVLF